MEKLVNTISDICETIQRVSDFVWDFPTNIDAYASIPILGHLPFSVLVLIGSGIWFTIRLRFIQVRAFGKGIRLLAESKSTKDGISPLASFFLSTAMRVGPGNILGVTGAISIGGPGALVWMWVSAFFGMATAYVESTLSQIFKEKRGGGFVGGFPFYGRRLLRNSAAVGTALSVLYVTYALLCLPAQGFNVISAVEQISVSCGEAFGPTPAWCSAGVLLLCLILISFGGVKKVSKVTDIVVPVMAVIYIAAVVLLIGMNVERIPWFFETVFEGAFRPDAMFGGTAGLCVAQGIRRGLMSNEAGQGTITMPAATSDVKHPCEQGCIQAVGVFLDTMVICTLTAFVVIMGRMWLTDGAAEWFSMGKLPKFIASMEELAPSAAVKSVMSVTMSLCFGLFAFTCLLGFISFAEICAARVSEKIVVRNAVRTLCLVVVAFGILTSLTGFDLGALWNLSDFANITMVFVNVPIIWRGFKYVLEATRSFNKGESYSSSISGLELPCWDQENTA